MADWFYIVGVCRRANRQTDLARVCMVSPVACRCSSILYSDAECQLVSVIFEEEAASGSSAGVTVICYSSAAVPRAFSLGIAPLSSLSMAVCGVEGTF